MLAREARRMGFRVVVFTDEAPGCPAGQEAEVEMNAGYGDAEARAKFVKQVDVVTAEFENIPAAFLAAVEKAVPVFPPPAAIEITQNREREKNFLRGAGIPCAEFRVVDSAAALEAAVAELGLPCVLKTAAFGYDGKGQRKLTGGEDLEEVWTTLGVPRGVVEAWVPFQCEVSVVAARGQDGQFVPFACVENIHTHHILDFTLAPARVPAQTSAAAVDLARRVAEALNYVGTMAVELFVLHDGTLLVNEIAPRPHNSGHYTIDACETNQFEQQLRAVTGMPLGNPAQPVPAVMVNLLGDVWYTEVNHPDWSPVLSHPRANLHLYGKKKALPGRKMGHFTVLAPTVEQAFAEARAIKEELLLRRATVVTGV